MKASNLITFLAGAALGVTAALLFAPDKGSNTRKEIQRKLKKHGINLNKKELNEFINRFTGKKPVENLVDKEA